MDWKALIIPLIPLAIWVIVSIFRAREEAKEDQQPQPIRGDGLHHGDAFVLPHHGDDRRS